MDVTCGKIYVFGGWDGVKDLDELWMYDLGKKQWTCLDKDSDKAAASGSNIPTGSEVPHNLVNTELAHVDSEPSATREADVVPERGNEELLSVVPRANGPSTTDTSRGDGIRRGFVGAPTPRSCGAAVFVETSGEIYILGRFLPRVADAPGTTMMSREPSAAELPGMANESTPVAGTTAPVRSMREFMRLRTRLGTQDAVSRRVV
jgi:hypothetical protein